jgi:tryptophan-rich sensory protein
MLAAAPQLLDHPVDVIVRDLPWGFFLVVHIALFAVGAYCALRAYEKGQSLFGTGFVLFALAEISYMTYHVNITNFLFAHTISEVLDGVAFVLVFAAAVQNSLVTSSASSKARAKGGVPVGAEQ